MSATRRAASVGTSLLFMATLVVVAACLAVPKVSTPTPVLPATPTPSATATPPATPTPAPPAPGRPGMNRALWEISPLGRIAYLWEGDLYTSELDGSDTIRLTEHGTAYWRFSWSPDGRTLLYGTIPPGGDINTPARIWAGDARGPGAVPFPGGELVPVTWSWSPDERRLVFNAQGSWVVNADGTGLRRLEPPPSPDPRRGVGVGRWLDNQRVFYSSGCSTGCARLGLLDVDTGESTLLGEMGPIDVAPDGKRLIYAEKGPGKRIYLLDLQDLQRREVYLAEKGRIYDVLWLDQKHIAFSQHDVEGLEAPGSYHGYMLDLATGEKVEIEGLYLAPRSSFSPDRRFFLYAPQKSPSNGTRYYTDPPQEERGLWRVEIATGRRYLIARPGPKLNIGTWGWSPEGQRVVFTQRLVGPMSTSTVSLWVAEADGSAAVPLAPNALTPRPPATPEAATLGVGEERSVARDGLSR